MTNFIEISGQAASAVIDSDAFILVYYKQVPGLSEDMITAGYAVGHRENVVSPTIATEQLMSKMKLAHGLADLCADDDEILSSLCVALCLNGRGQEAIRKMRETLSTPGADGRKLGGL